MEEAVREFARDEFRPDVWEPLAQATRYHGTDFADEAGEDRLGALLTELDEERGTLGNRVYYLAVPPQAMPTIVQELGEGARRRGRRGSSSRSPSGTTSSPRSELNEVIHRFFSEDEVFRIDHYLGKETVQNMLALRFANGIFEPIWNRQFIDHVQITVAESLGIEGRASFYERAGAIRDIFQNHLLQLVALTAMEPPIDFTADACEKREGEGAAWDPASAARRGRPRPVRARMGRGREVAGYREEEGVDPESMTETFLALELHVDNWRWADTPFYVRTGKRLPRRETTIAIQFKRAPHLPFESTAAEELRPNLLLVHVQPDEGISLAIGAKVPGQGMRLRTVHMDFMYGGSFRTGLPEAYERLILDAMRGDATLFTRADEVDEQWTLVDAIVEGWKGDRPSFPNYEAGGWGPPEADELIQRGGRAWRRT